MGLILKTIVTSTGSFTLVIGTRTEVENYSSANLSVSDEGKYIAYITDEDAIYFWDGNQWR
jgi:hypothetical protein